MKSRGLMRAMCLLMAGLLGVGSLRAAPRDPAVPPQPACQCEDANYQAEASELLRKLNSQAARLADDADVLSIYARGSISRETHARQMTLVREHINAIGKQLDRLQAIRHVAAPWQQRAISSVVPMAVNLAAQTEAAILRL